MENNDTDSILDSALKAINFESAINTHTGFERSDDPPQNIVFRVKKVIGQKRESTKTAPAFPYEDGIFHLDKREVQKLQLEMGSKLLDYLQKELSQIDEIVHSNSISISESSRFDQRRHFFYLTLLSILGLPKDAAFKKLDTLISIKKLLVNKYLIDQNIDLEIPEKSCIVHGCPRIALHGSDYCSFHILHDPRQKLFTNCKICGWPQLLNSQCCGHCET